MTTMDPGVFDVSVVAIIRVVSGMSLRRYCMQSTVIWQL